MGKKKNTDSTAITGTTTASTATTTDTAPRKVIPLNGHTPNPRPATALASFIATRQAREFPDFTSQLDTTHEFTFVGEFDVYQHSVPGQRAVEFLIAFIEDTTTHEIFGVGSWEFCPRLKTLHVNDADITPRWAIDANFDRNSLRDAEVLRIPTGTRLHVHRQRGYVVNPLVPPTRERTITWISLD